MSRVCWTDANGHVLLQARLLAVTVRYGGRCVPLSPLSHLPLRLSHLFSLHFASLFFSLAFLFPFPLLLFFFLISCVCPCSILHPTMDCVPRPKARKMDRHHHRWCQLFGTCRCHNLLVLRRRAACYVRTRTDALISACMVWCTLPVAVYVCARQLHRNDLSMLQPHVHWEAQRMLTVVAELRCTRAM